MARKTTVYTIEAGEGKENRDTGKTFLLTEMPALQAERLAFRVLMLAIRGGVQVDDSVVAGGFAALQPSSLMKCLARIPFSEVEPLLDELMKCVQIIPTPSRPDVVRSLVDGDIEEASTLLTLRYKVIELHQGF